MELAQPLTTVRRVADDRAAPLEEGANETTNVVVIVDHEDPGLGHTLFIPRASAVPS